MVHWIDISINFRYPLQSPLVTGVKPLSQYIYIYIFVHMGSVRMYIYIIIYVHVYIMYVHICYIELLAFWTLLTSRISRMIQPEVAARVAECFWLSPRDVMTLACYEGNLCLTKCKPFHHLPFPTNIHKHPLSMTICFQVAL